MSVEVVRARCAGVDVHKHTVVVHIITPETRETRTFGTMTDELCELRRHRTQRVIGQSADRTKRVICRHPLLGRQVAQHMLRLLVGSAHVEAPFLTACSHRSTSGSLCRSLTRTFSATCYTLRLPPYVLAVRQRRTEHLGGTSVWELDDCRWPGRST